MTADILIPTYRPGDRLKILLDRLNRQSYQVHKILIMNTEPSFFPKGLEDAYENVDVFHLTKAEFDHGGTRDLGIRRSSADIVVCMTQDALPADDHLLENLLAPFSQSDVWAAYARQLPAEGCSEVEKFTRSFNYPKESRVKGEEDLETLGIKAFFCSNVCAAWRRDQYLKHGGFEKKTIFNEDMILAGKLIRQGGQIAYCGNARVIHSHNYSMAEQFHRYFDLAVSQTMHPEVFGGVRSESEGMRLVKKTVAHCLKIKKPWLIWQVVTQNAGKLLGYKAGQQYKKLPQKVILWCTMNRSFWQEEGI